MQYLEDDMDDLFRKAADQYLVLTDARDWDGLAVGLAEPDNATKLKRKFYPTYIIAAVLLLLLIAVTSLMVNYNHNAPDFKKEINNTNSMPASTKQLAITNLPSNNKIVTAYKVPSRSHNKILQKKHVANRVHPLFENENSSYNKHEHHKHYRQLRIDSIPVLEENIGPMFTKINNPEGSGAGITINIEALPKLKMDSGKLLPSQQSGPITLTKSKPFYADIIGGIQMNQVAGQGFTKPGFILGIIGGYQISKSFGAALGILYSSKHYFSDGQYFDIGKAGTSMPANMKIINLQGSSQLIEIPIGLRYNFIHTKSKWFISSGISSFVLTREQNNYLAIINGIEQNMNGLYHHKTVYVASAINFSMGTEFRVGKKQTRLKIEPFLQVPVKGMGIGLMSVTGAGIRIGMGLPFH